MKYLSTWIVVIFALTGCDNENHQNSIYYSGLVINDRIENAKVCFDCNESWACEENELSTYSNTQSQFSFPLALAESVKQCPLVAEISADSIDVDSNQPISAPFTLVAPSGSKMISPLTTMHFFQMWMGDGKQKAEENLQRKMLIDTPFSHDYISAQEKFSPESIEFDEADHMQKVANHIAQVLASNFDFAQQWIIDEQMSHRDVMITSLFLQHQRLANLVNEVVQDNFKTENQTVTEYDPSIQNTTVLLLPGTSLFGSLCANSFSIGCFSIITNNTRLAEHKRNASKSIYFGFFHYDQALIGVNTLSSLPNTLSYDGETSDSSNGQTVMLNTYASEAQQTFTAINDFSAFSEIREVLVGDGWVNNLSKSFDLRSSNNNQKITLINQENPQFQLIVEGRRYSIEDIDADTLFMNDNNISNTWSQRIQSAPYFEFSNLAVGYDLQISPVTPSTDDNSFIYLSSETCSVAEYFYLAGCSGNCTYGTIVKDYDRNRLNNWDNVYHFPKRNGQRSALPAGGLIVHREYGYRGSSLLVKSYYYLVANPDNTFRIYSYNLETREITPHFNQLKFNGWSSYTTGGERVIKINVPTQVQRYAPTSDLGNQLTLVTRNDQVCKAKSLTSFDIQGLNDQAMSELIEGIGFTQH
ncbi:hypothetical protein SOPP22_07280 [Shewanella sp. OPT22]|nr:hypothetical protein SOPP22_07280 [Shewanella sp. OPT22]